MRAFWAKVVGRSVDGGCGGLDAREEKGEVLESGQEANGLAGWEFWVLEVENGFRLDLAEVEVVELKRLLPRLAAECSGFGVSGDAVPFAIFFGFSAEAFETLMPLMALMVPSFFRHAFRLQLKI